jgi:DDB1- and CUL4-associated factor 7
MSLHDAAEPPRSQGQNEAFTYKAPWPTYAFSFSDRLGTFLIGSMLEQCANHLELLSFSPDSSKIVQRACAPHQYPATKIMWAPVPMAQEGLFATSSDYLRLWRCENNELSIAQQLLPHYENKEYNGPLTSFDWSARDPTTLGTASIDKTCTIWDLNKNSIKKQILAHSNEVNDIAFSHDPNIFVSASTDASVRKFDLRSLEQCSIIYDNPRNNPVVRVCWNKIDPNYLAILCMDSATVTFLDIRNQMFQLPDAKNHQSGINCMCWSPSSYGICTGGDDSMVFIRDFAKNSAGQKDVPLSYAAQEKVLNLSWSAGNEIGMVLPNSVHYIKLSP